MGPIRSSSQKEQSSQLAPYSVQQMKSLPPRSQQSNPITAYFNRLSPSTLSQLADSVASPPTESVTSSNNPSQQSSQSADEMAVNSSEDFSQNTLETVAGLQDRCTLCNGSGQGLIRCCTCSKFFHQNCIKLTEVPSDSSSSWKCLVCKIASELTFQSCYNLLAENASAPLAPVLAYLCKEISEIKQQLSRRITSLDEDMTETVEVVKPRRVIIIGNDVRGMKPTLREILNHDSRCSVISHTDKDIGLLLDEAKTLIEADAQKHLIKLVLHPGIYNCQLLQGEKLLAQIFNFATWVASTAPNVELNVVSIPQVIKHECQSVNDGLEKMADEKLLRFIPLTIIQSKLLINGDTSYDSETAKNVSGVLARYTARFLQVNIRKSKIQKEETRLPNMLKNVRLRSGNNDCHSTPPLKRSTQDQQVRLPRRSYRAALLGHSQKPVTHSRPRNSRDLYVPQPPRQARISDWVPKDFPGKGHTPQQRRQSRPLGRK